MSKHQMKRARAWQKIYEGAYGTGHKSVSSMHIEPDEPKEKRPTKPARKSWFVRSENKDIH